MNDKSSVKRNSSPKVAVITGGARGLGQAYALRLAEDGCDIAIGDLDEASETVSRIEAVGRRAISIVCDVSKPSDVEALAKACDSAYGRCDILVNNAGIYPGKVFEALSFQDWRRVMSVNADSLFLTAKAFVPGMKQTGWGRIINMASNSFGLVVPGLVHYVASKGAVIGFTRALASELGAFGITVNAIAPGITRTPGTVGSGGTPQGDVESVFKMTAEQQAIKRTADPSDIVGTLSFVASDEAGFMTGQTIVVDGGWWRV
jgi:(S)-1-phenylethanol dehydrogenase